MKAISYLWIFPGALRFMHKVIIVAVMAFVLITVWCRSAYGESPQVVMRVALAVAPPFEFLLEQDAYAFPLLPARIVDEDEEALDLVKFQNAYNLASKMVSVMAEMYDRLILETGV